jgi:signal transduction histidine kinase
MTFSHLVAWKLGFRRRPGESPKLLYGSFASARFGPIEGAWGVFAVANLVAMAWWPKWETVPFHFIWVSLTLLYGFRVWRPTVTGAVLLAVGATTGSLILIDDLSGIQGWGELLEVPLMSAMFLAMVWHATRRQEALARVEREAAQRASLLERQERFLHDASHELRTPITIARGHLEVLRRLDRPSASEIDVALDELGRMERIVERLLLLAKADQPDFLATRDIELDSFLEDVFVRWSEVAPRAWRLGELPKGILRADSEGLRIALDALLENAVKYTGAPDAIELRARPGPRGEVLVEVADEGSGIPDQALGRIFERFGRADPARSRAYGGVGLGLAIVDAIAKAHGGSCDVETSARGSTFALRLPGFRTAPDRPSQAGGDRVRAAAVPVASD